MTRGRATSACLALSVVAACGGAPVPDARFPRRPEGCQVRLFNGAPEGPTTNIGVVRADCAFDVSEVDCLRTLLDQVCQLGGDVVWGVADKPTVSGDKNHWEGRAAHTGSFPLR